MNRVSVITLCGAGLLLGTAAAADPYEGRYRVPRGHLPPPGECRVWYPDRPPGQQPPPTDCRNARYEANRTSGFLVRGGREGRDERRYRRDRQYDRDDHRDRCDEKDYLKGEC